MKNEVPEILEKNKSKVCTKCWAEKLLEEFPVDRKRKDGRRAKCFICRREVSKKWQWDNRDKVAAQAVRWREKHPAYLRIYRMENKEMISKINRRCYLKRINKPGEKLNRQIFRGIHHALRDNYNGILWASLVGFNREQLCRHLESLFQPGMAWENYGKWEIDHKIPLCAFKFTTPDDPDFKRCWDINNLQPLWSYDNSKKGMKK